MNTINDFPVPPGCKEISSKQQASKLEWPEIKPLQRELPPAPPFPVDAMGALKAPVMRAAEVIQAPVAICAFSFLAAANLAVQPHASIRIDGRISPISEFFVSIAGTGERKSAVDAEALQPHREWQQKQWEIFENDRSKYAGEKEVYENSRQQILKDTKKTSTSKNSELEKLVCPVPPVSPMFLVSEPTYEGLTKLLATGHPSIGLFSDEGGRFIGGHAMSSDHQLKTAAGLSSLWDRGEIDRVRSGDGSSIHYGKRLALHLMLQPDVSALLLANRGLKDQGFLSRCLVVRPDFVRKSYVSIDLSKDSSILNYRRTISGILELALPMKDGQTNVLQPRILELEPAAKAAYESVHDFIQSQVGPGERFELVKGFANKAHDHIARLAATFALYENIHCTSITASQFERARVIVLHCVEELLRLIDVEATDDILMKAEQHLVWLQKRGKPAVSLVEIYKTGLNFIRNVSAARKYMDVLEAHGYVRPSMSPVEYLGVTRSEAYEIRISVEGSP